MESNVFNPVMRWPPMTSGTSRPNSSFTFRSADSIAALFSGLLKSVSGSFLNSVRVGISLRPPACSGDGMYSKSPPTATLMLALALAACSSALPWQNEPIGQEVNVAFTVRKNLVVLPSVTIDGRSGMTVFPFAAEPMINVTVDGRSVAAIVDTTSPDTLVLPRGTAAAGRRTAHLVVGGTDFGNVDVLFADVAQARAGNRLLSKFLVAIDYGRRQVGLWRDPRTAL